MNKKRYISGIISLFLMILIWYVYIQGIQWNPVWWNDVMAPSRDWKPITLPFDPPVPGVTTRADLDRMWPQGPSRIYSYATPFIKTVNGKSFISDQHLRYGMVDGIDLKMKSGMTHSCPVNDMVVFVFMYKDTVQFYSNKHIARKYDSEGCYEAAPGSYDNFKKIYHCKDSISPGGRGDWLLYFYQRWLDKPDSDFVKNYDDLNLFFKLDAKIYNLFYTRRDSGDVVLVEMYNEILKNTAKQFRPLTDREQEVLRGCWYQGFDNVLQTIEKAKTIDEITDSIFDNCGQYTDPCLGITRENSGPGEWENILKDAERGKK
jgi:hypothetical protein